MKASGQFHAPVHFTLGTHWIGYWVGPTAGLDAVGEEKNFHNCPRLELNPGRPARSVVSVPTELSLRTGW